VVVAPIQHDVAPELLVATDLDYSIERVTSFRVLTCWCCT
jgi:hypothetical protein